MQWYSDTSEFSSPLNLIPSNTRLRLRAVILFKNPGDFVSVAEMNGFNDSHKRTSISQLLNPAISLQSSAYPPPPAIAAGPAQTHNEQQGVPSFQQSYGLRAASWDRQDEGTGRNQDNPPTPSRPYQQMHPPDVYGDQPARPTRSRADDSNGFSVENAGWHPPHEIANLSYGAPVIAPMYSDERTGEWHTYFQPLSIADY